MSAGYTVASKNSDRRRADGGAKGKMNTSTLIKQYLKKRRENEDTLGCYPFITISRQAGSGSKELAEEIVRQIGGKLDAELAESWEIFDQELCQLIVDDPKIESSLQDLITEEYHSEIEEIIYDMIRGTSRQYRTYKKVFGVVRTLGVLGKTIIIGRGGAYVCKDMPLAVHIRLVASEAKRVEKLSALLGLDHGTALKKVRELETSRARLVKDFFNKNINDPANYTAVLNMDVLSTPEIAELVVEMAKQRMRKFSE